MSDNTKYLRPVIGRQGNKYSLLKQIETVTPEHTKFVEPFAGSGVVWLNKEPADVNILNDLDKSIKTRFSLIKNAPTDITKYKHFDTDEQAQVFYNKTPTTAADKLLHFRTQQMGGFNNIPLVNDKVVRKVNISNGIIQSIIQTKQLLKHTKILNQDYVSVIKKYDSPNTFFFVDPPYKGSSSKGFGYAEADGKFDYDRLFNTLDNIKGMFLLTINDLPEFRKQYKNYKIKYVSIPNTRDHTIRKELFIMNYDF